MTSSDDARDELRGILKRTYTRARWGDDAFEEQADAVIEWQRSRSVSEPSEEAIEAAAIAFSCETADEWRNDLSEDTRATIRKDARDALKAAAEVSNG